ncbi:hypothetical protein [Cupriavidus nantongensis]|uniref:Amino acid transporter n=1 Tax=Cupriavidus nantongensis TaxID=1796606 RepID=A0A142JGR5_9BURK|nr:hypothetical protein [Cupriavidus nantongensis]AMR77277.1 hypothetical protein A2G96_05765 [Cupriavidus nantongensis]
MLTFIQILIFLTSVSAVYLLTGRPAQHRWGALVGLIGQPLWLYVTIRAETWGIVAVSAWFLVCYARGVYLGFFRDAAAKTR